MDSIGASSTASNAAESSATSEFGLCAADCGKSAVLRCSGCLGAFYCGQACQKREWKQHKEQCKIAAEAIASLGGGGGGKCDTIDDFDMKYASYKMEAAAGYANSQYRLGVCYAHGSGVAVDKAEAVKWFKRAAEAGDVDAQIALTKL